MRGGLRGQLSSKSASQVFLSGPSGPWYFKAISAQCVTGSGDIMVTSPLASSSSIWARLGPFLNPLGLGPER